MGEKTQSKAIKLQQEIDKIEADLAKLYKQKKWNAGNMCKTVEDTNIVSAPAAEVAPEPRLSGEAVAEGYCEFIEANEELLEEYISMGSSELEEVFEFMKKHGGTLLQGEHAESYLLLDCLEKEMNDDHEGMVFSARQNQLIVQIREFSRGMRRPARDAVHPVFSRLLDHEETQKSFQDAVNDFVKRIEKRAVVKKVEMDKEAAEAEQGADEEGPGGLTPMEVFKTLPEEMQAAFIAKDMPRLHEAIAALPEDEAKHHMQRCELSGLWVPNAAEGPPPYQR